MNRIFFLIVTFIVFSFSASATAGVVIYDEVYPANKSVKLKALTKGNFFPEGGRLVKFYAGGKYIGTHLSGGDGYAFMRYKTTAPGIINIRAETGEDADEGVLLVAGKRDRIIFVEIEGALFESLIAVTPSENGKKALKQLSKKFRIIYLTTLIGVSQSRQWLKENEFPLSPVMKWEGPEMITGLSGRGIKVYAVIGSPDLLSESSDISRKFSFSETENGTEVKDWDDLLKQLKIKPKK